MGLCKSCTERHPPLDEHEPFHSMHPYEWENWTDSHSLCPPAEAITKRGSPRSKTENPHSNERQSDYFTIENFD